MKFVSHTFSNDVNDKQNDRDQHIDAILLSCDTRMSSSSKYLPSSYMEAKQGQGKHHTAASKQFEKWGGEVKWELLTSY